MDKEKTLMQWPGFEDTPVDVIIDTPTEVIEYIPNKITDVLNESDNAPPLQSTRRPIS